MIQILSRHPKGLPYLFMTEVWERFTFYGLQSIFVLYLTKQLMFNDEQASDLWGTFGALLFVMPVLGGIFADRWLGYRKAVSWGAVLMAIGAFGLTVQVQAMRGVTGADATAADLQTPAVMNLFYLSLSFLVVGQGFLKSNISTLVGRLYEEDEGNRDAGFSIFYIGINLGGWLGPLIVGALGEKVDFRLGFLATAISMLFALWMIHAGKRHFHGRGEPADPVRLNARHFGLPFKAWLLFAALLVVAVIWLLVRHEALMQVLIFGGGAVTLLTVLGYAFLRCDRVARDRLLVATAMIVFSMVFWALYFQQYSSVLFFASRLVDRDVFGWFTIEASQLASFSAFFVIVMAGAFAWIWTALSRIGREPSIPIKFACGLLITGAGYFLLIAGGGAANGALVGIMWVIAWFLVIVTGEMFISPVGLSMVTKLAPPRIGGFMMGAWFLGISMGIKAGGLLAASAKIEDVETAIATGSIYGVYEQLWWINAGLGIGSGLIVLMMARGLYRRMHGMH